MHEFKLEARNNDDFLFVRTVTRWAALYDIGACVLRAQLRRPGAGQAAAFEFSTLNGRILWNAEAKQISMSARAAEIGGLLGVYVFDVRLEIDNAVRAVLYAGDITFIDGATK